MASIPLSRLVSSFQLSGNSLKTKSRQAFPGLDRSFSFACQPSSLHHKEEPRCGIRWNTFASKLTISDYLNDDSRCNNEHSEKGPNQVDHLVQTLHQSVDGFITAIQSHEFSRREPQLASAWVGIDVYAWHKHVAYEATVYALLQSLLINIMLVHHEVKMDADSILKILSPAPNVLGEHIESELNMKDVKLVEWFKMEQMPLMKRKFSSLLGRWYRDYIKSLPIHEIDDAGTRTRNSSEVAIVTLAIGCCVAVNKLGSGRISCTSFCCSLSDIILELMDMLNGLVQVNEHHYLACVSGFEYEFLAHFGSKATHCDTSREVVFWMSLVQKKLIVAFQREGIAASIQNIHKAKGPEYNLATFGLFALLGLQTRLFLSCMFIKNLDEPVKDFLSYLECGSLFIYPELSSMSVYQNFMEVVYDEIGWLDFYNVVPSCMNPPEKRRSKQHPIQAEKEIIFSTIFNICSGVFSRYVEYVKSTHQYFDVNMMTFLLRSQNLLDICLEDYGSAYYKSSELLKVGQRPEQDVPVDRQDLVNGNTSVELHRRIPIHVTNARVQMADWLYKDIWAGTRLLIIDMSVAWRLTWKQIFGKPLTSREKKKLGRTTADIIAVIPVAILMLLPVSAVGHAAILAAIKKYTPCLIPSTYSSERVDSVKQLDRAKKMEVQLWSNPEMSTMSAS